MKKIKIKLKVKNKNNPYKYEGIATLNKDIITFIDNDEEYIFDKTINRLTKIKKDNKIVLDFNLEIVNISDKNNNMSFDIKIINKNIDDNKIEFIYTMGDEDIVMNLFIEGEINE